MNRHLPQATKAASAINLYLVWKETGPGGRTIYAQVIKRQMLEFAEPRGKCARYNRRYRKLHPETEFESFLQQQVKISEKIYLRGQPYEASNIKSLPFVVDWEEPV